MAPSISDLLTGQSAKQGYQSGERDDLAKKDRDLFLSWSWYDGESGDGVHYTVRRVDVARKLVDRRVAIVFV